MTGALRRVGASRFLQEDLRAAVVPWVLARILVVGTLAVSRQVFEELGRTGRSLPLAQGLLSWDAAWYRAIAEHGYGSLPREAFRFFPLYPLLGRWTGVVLLDHTAAALLLLANAGGLVFAALLYRLTLRETADAATARRAAWFATLLPPAMVLVLGYAESLALCLGVGLFLLMRSRRWLPAIPLGVLAGLCRPVGLLLVVPTAIEALRGWLSASTRERAASLAAVGSPVVGTGLYLAWVGSQTDDPLLPFSIQSRPKLRGSLVDPVSRSVDAVGDLFGTERFGSGLHIVWIVLCAALVVVLARQLAASYAAYAAAAVLLALTASNLDSFERYAMSTFPLVIGVALVTKRPAMERAGLVLASGGLVAYATLAFYGRYVP
ncbi:MAG: hypothetical protein MUP97_00535 [Acidimicrobiia bacterium]|nr:hypothetical protein [Acidimicrobiia bacterium]